MDGLITKLSSDELLGLCGILLGLVAILGGISIGLVAVLAHHFRRSRMDDIEATLKLEMLERGMSADEIQKVLSARAARLTPYAAIGAAGTWRDLRREWAKS